MKSKKLIAMLMLVIVLMTGCAELVEGEVVDKSYKPSRTTIHYTMIGKSMVPRTQRHPERWYITVYSEEHGEDKAVSVPEKDYLNTEIGDFYSNEHLLPEEAKKK